MSSDDRSSQHSAIYRHYPTKEAVAQSLYSHFLQLVTDGLREAAESGQEAKERLQAMVQTPLEQHRQNPAATFVLLRKHNFTPLLPPDFVFPLEIVVDVIKEGQAQKLIQSGRPDLLAAIFLGCVLQPIIFAKTEDSDGLDLEQRQEVDELMKEAAWSALSYHQI